MGQNILSRSNCRILKPTISPEHISEFFLDFLQVDTNLHKIKLIKISFSGHGQKWV